MNDRQDGFNRAYAQQQKQIQSLWETSTDYIEYKE